jgi:transposase
MTWLISFAKRSISWSWKSSKFDERGCGSEQFPPRMMLALLIYCYSHGIFGSRRIEAATHQHLSVRYLGGNTHPDHDTICKFRRENFEAIAGCFLRVLELARELGLLRVGTVAIDGTRLRASASKHRNVTDARAGASQSSCSRPTSLRFWKRPGTERSEIACAKRSPQGGRGGARQRRHCARGKRSAADHHELEPGLAAIPVALGAPVRVLADSRRAPKQLSPISTSPAKGRASSTAISRMRSRTRS